MLSVVDLKFNNEKHFKKEKVIYHKGNVIGRPKTASRPLLIPRIKKVQIQHRKNEQKNTLTEEEEEKHKKAKEELQLLIYSEYEV